MDKIVPLPFLDVLTRPNPQVQEVGARIVDAHLHGINTERAQKGLPPIAPT